MIPPRFHFVWALAITLEFGSASLAATSASDANQSEDVPSTSLDQRKTVDFRSEVWPILEQRCFSCHGSEQQLGDLRLDSLAEIQDGGHSGSVILGTVEDSELIRRIVSTEEGYRMPKDETPLSTGQIEVVRQWIAQGATWESPPLKEQIVIWGKARDWNQHLDQLTWGHSKIGWLGYPAIVLLCLVLLIERAKRSLSTGTGEAASEDGGKASASWIDKLASRFGYSHYLAGALMFVITAIGILHWYTYWELHELREGTRGISWRSTGRSTRVKTSFEIPKPIRPLHPPRMGGEYYRGNDERNEKLFNGGFYRTATMTVNLQDEQGNLLAWDSPVAAGSLDVFVRIERAPSATRSLFLDQAMAQTTMTRQLPNVQNEAFDDIPAQFEIEQPGQSWIASYRIGEVPQDDSSDQTLSGLIYLGRSASQPHYGVDYRVEIRDGKISRESELWMGAILLTGNVVQVEPGKIPISEWFGFQPIPEITGENSDDPTLLGITEHQANEQSGADPAGNIDASAQIATE